jgi:hypothetical protein
MLPVTRLGLCGAPRRMSRLRFYLAARKAVPSRGPLVAVEEPKAEGSIPSWRAIAEGTGRYVSTRTSVRRMSSSDPPAVPTMATDPRR